MSGIAKCPPGTLYSGRGTSLKLKVLECVVDGVVGVECIVMVTNIQWVFRIIQSIPTPNAEPLKQYTSGSLH